MTCIWEQPFLNLSALNDEDESLFEEYIELCEQVTAMDIYRHPQLLDSYAKGIYKKLVLESGNKNYMYYKSVSI